MAEKIHILRDDGNLESLTEQPFDTDVMLQLIGQHPELLGGEQMRPDDPLRWIFIKPEMPVAGWAVDHLLIDHEARPTLVEVKKGNNREERHTIVGQLLDYAATVASVWSGDGMRRAFEDDARRRGIDPLDELIQLLQLPGAETDLEDIVNQFWENAAWNLSDGRLRLLFVADEISVGMEQLVKFLNEQTRDAFEILAVEVKQYPGQFGNVLVSRLIGQDDPLAQNVPHLPRISSNRCLCGCGKYTNKVFVPGHDAKLNATLGRVDKGKIQAGDIDLGYAAGRCQDNPNIFAYNHTGRFYNKWSCEDIIRLAKQQADLKRQL